ncbi:MAG: polysaccharide deacetylase family protein [Oscillospiraceae bacterium]|nr:polysaccharide deacetylase family protein [Oscillospiraceae bacterium]
MYFGSVRFFKNLIFFTVLALIIIPSVLAFKYYHETVRLREAPPLVADDADSHGSPDSLFEPNVAHAAAEESLTGQPDAAETTPSLEEDPAAQQGQAEETSPPEQASSDGEPLPDEEPFSLSADPPAYQALYEDFYAPEAFHAESRVENAIYLTFDDGPSERTDEILDTLAEKGVHATFFVVGQSDPDNLERMQRIVAEGHTIGMHSYTHDYNKVYASVEGFLEEFYRCFCQIRDVTGVTPTVFRCPGGSINGYDGGFYQEILSEMIRRGFVPYDWNVSSEDAATNRTLPVETLVDNVVRNSTGKFRSIVLFHDSASKTTSAQAIGPVIDQLRANGYTFERITPDTMPVLYSYPRL